MAKTVQDKETAHLAKMAHEDEAIAQTLVDDIPEWLLDKYLEGGWGALVGEIFGTYKVTEKQHPPRPATMALGDGIRTMVNNPHGAIRWLNNSGSSTHAKKFAQYVFDQRSRYQSINVGKEIDQALAQIAAVHGVAFVPDPPVGKRFAKNWLNSPFDDWADFRNTLKELAKPREFWKALRSLAHGKPKPARVVAPTSAVVEASDVKQGQVTPVSPQLDQPPRPIPDRDAQPVTTQTAPVAATVTESIDR